jgi:CheY-like chemotaxis protein
LKQSRQREHYLVNMNNSQNVNHPSGKPSEIPPLEPGLENHTVSAAGETDTTIQDGFLEKKPVKDILFVDDEKPICKLFQAALGKFGYNVRVAPNGNEGMKALRESPVDLVITDIFMPEKDGHEFIMEIMQEFPEVKIFAITGHKSYESEMELDIAKTLGAIEVFTKPCKLSVVLNAIKALSAPPPASTEYSLKTCVN